MDAGSAGSILIVHPDRKTQRIIQRVLGGTGYRVDVTDDLAGALALLPYVAPALVVFDQALAGAATELVAAAHAAGAEACLTLTPSEAARDLPAILDLAAVTNLLVHPLPVLAEELSITAHKLIRGDLFGAEKYLLWGTTLHTATPSAASQRTELATELAARVRACGQSARTAANAMLVADELLSNAVHNAPVDAAGTRYRAELPRTAELALDGRHAVRLRWGCDARYLAIEVGDQFGSLDRATILESLATREVRESGSGAGMGIPLVYRSCDHLVFNLAPGARTEVIALIDIRYAASGSPSAERTPASSYNVFVGRSEMDPRP
jgi:CheY-like chemotaxis protein